MDLSRLNGAISVRIGISRQFLRNKSLCAAGLLFVFCPEATHSVVAEYT